MANYGTSYLIISLMIMIISCFVGLAGWLKGRDTKISNDGEWRGSVNTKLDTIIGTTSKMDTILDNHEKRITETEQSVKQAHKRIDELRK